MANQTLYNSIKDLSVEELEDKLSLYETAYWEGNHSLVPDEVYDMYHRAYQDKTGRHRPVGHKSGTVKHDRPMLSLRNVYSEDELKSWIDTVSKEDKDLLYSVGPKLDGLAVSIHLNEEGHIKRVLTRGNGSEGRDITAFAKDIKGFPETPLPTYKEIRGEVIVFKSSLSEINQKKGEKTYSTPRHAAAGLLLKSDDPLKSYLRFMAYDACPKDQTVKTEMQLLQPLSETCTIAPVNFYEADKVFEACRSIIYDSNSDLPIDGAVVKIYNLQKRESLGYTAHHPRGAVAVKLHDIFGDTYVRDVDWTIGLHGRLTPTIIVDPVSIEGVTITRVTANNAGYFLTGGFKEGNHIIIKRAGSVIPKIVSHEPVEDGWTLPETCPYCQGPTSYTWPYLTCSSLDPKVLCWGIAEDRLRHFVSRHGLDLKGFGDRVISWCFDHGLDRHYKLLAYFRSSDSRDTLVKKFGELIADKLINVASRDIYPLERILTALEIPSMGKTLVREYSLYFKSFHDWLEMIKSGRLYPKDIDIPLTYAWQTSLLEYSKSSLDDLIQLGSYLRTP